MKAEKSERNRVELRIIQGAAIFILGLSSGLSAGFFIWGRTIEQRLRDDEIRTLLRLVERNAADDKDLRQLAALFVWKGDYDRALTYAAKAVSVDQKKPENWVTYGACLRRLFLRCEEKSSTRCDWIRSEMEKAGGALLEICRMRRKQGEMSSLYIHYLLEADALLREAGRKKQADEARELAIKTAKEWADSHSSVERDLGERYLDLIQLRKGTERPKAFSLIF